MLHVCKYVRLMYLNNIIFVYIHTYYIHMQRLHYTIDILLQLLVFSYLQYLTYIHTQYTHIYDMLYIRHIYRYIMSVYLRRSNLT